MDYNYNVKKDKEKYLMLIPIITLLIILIGGSYAFLEAKDDDNSIAGTTECYTVNYTKGQDISGELNLGTDYTSGKSTDIVMYSDPDCADMTGTLYITTNESSTMDFTDNALRYTVVVNDTVVSEGAVNGTANQVIYKDFTLNTTETTYKVYIWLNSDLEDTTNGDDESYSGFIHAEAVATSNVKPDYALATLTSLGLDDLLNEESPTTFTGPATTDEGIYAAEDDLGTTYYFRGASTRNYVYFAGFYWRIIRINGDGTIRMIYDGTEAHDNGVSSTDRQVGTSVFNENYDSNGYVGYMYGSTLGSTYALEHANDVNSTMKTYLEGDGTDANLGWYGNNLLDYEEYIADAIYCNDREVVTDDLKYQMWWEDVNYTAGNGIGTSETLYGTIGRLESNDNYYNLSEATPTFKCAQKNDRFTKVGSTIETTDGLGTNQKLRYPVGLITADEILFAGGYWDTNESYYLYSGNWYWTMSPVYFFGAEARVWIDEGGGINDGGYVFFSGGGVRPVLSLSSTAITGGTGTKTNPFTVSS